MVQDVKPGGVFMINCQWSDEELEHHLNAEAKKYIADNNIQLYTINAIDKAIEIGMGKRTNTILQSAFFKLANVMPIEEAVDFMKAAAKKSYGKKGDAVVEMNYKAIDAGVDAVHKVEVPASWSNPAADPAKKPYTGIAKTVKMVEDLLSTRRLAPIGAILSHLPNVDEFGSYEGYVKKAHPHARMRFSCIGIGLDYFHPGFCSIFLLRFN